MENLLTYIELDTSLSEDDLLSFIKNNCSDKEFIGKLIMFEQENKVSILAEIMRKFSVSTLEKVIDNLLLLTSVYNIQQLLHYYPTELMIPFKNHLVGVCYQKHGFEQTKILVAKYYGHNSLFITLPLLEDNRSILDDCRAYFAIRNFLDSNSYMSRFNGI